jgi:hypothetical protein
VLQAALQAPQLPLSFAVFTHVAFAPLLHRVGVVAVGQVWPHASGVPLQVAVPLAGIGQSEHVVPHELVDVDVSGTQVPAQLW